MYMLYRIYIIISPNKCSFLTIYMAYVCSTAQYIYVSYLYILCIYIYVYNNIYYTIHILTGQNYDHFSVLDWCYGTCTA